MDWKSVGVEVARLGAPLLGGLLGGPAGAKLGAIVAAGLGAGESPAEVAAAIQTDPQSALKLVEIQNSHRADLERLRIGEIQADAADRADARKRDAALHQAGQHNYRADILAFLAVGGLISCVWLVAMQVDMPERAVNAIMFVAGVFAAAVRDVFSFEFGSSRESRRKTQLLLGRGGDSEP